LIENLDQDKESIVDNYLKGHNNCGLKVGDRVKVIRKADSYEKGWNNSWVPKMDKYLGCIGIIVKDAKEFGFRVKFECPGGIFRPYNYPYFVLEKVEEGK